MYIFRTPFSRGPRNKYRINVQTAFSPLQLATYLPLFDATKISCKVIFYDLLFIFKPEFLKGSCNPWPIVLFVFFTNCGLLTTSVLAVFFLRILEWLLKEYFNRNHDIISYQSEERVRKGRGRNMFGPLDINGSVLVQYNDAFEPYSTDSPLQIHNNTNNSNNT